MNQTIVNERLKLLATGFNNLALAFLIGGIVGPLVAGNQALWSRPLSTAAWVASGLSLHLCAQFVLGFLR